MWTVLETTRVAVAVGAGTSRRSIYARQQRLPSSLGCVQQPRWQRPRFSHRSNATSGSNSSKLPNSLSTSVTSFLIGTTAGICGSLAGMGGGFVMIPLLTGTSVIRLSQHAAHGTSLFAVATTGLAGALGYQGQVDYTAATCIALCGMVTARAGALATTRLSETKLRQALGVFMLAVAPLVPAKEYLIGRSKEIQKEFPEKMDEDGQSNTNMLQYLTPAAIGSCSGFLAGLFGVGGGAVVVPALTLFTDMNHYQALGTSLTAMVLPALSGTATHYAKGNVIMTVAPFLATGAFVGAYAGSKLALSVQEDSLKYGFSGVMVVLGLRALMK